MLRHQPVPEFKVKGTLVFKKEVPMVQITDSYVEPHSSSTLDTCSHCLTGVDRCPSSYTVSVRQ